jgi:8-oxo-dGTP pyrophosphatase MutT (NUDIX family)
MYKIYINTTPIFLVGTSEISHPLRPGQDEIIAPYNGKVKLLHNYIDMLEKGDRFKAVTLYYDQPEQLFADFAGLFKIIEAAGGIVYNEAGHTLLIFRSGSWDLPKGKIDPGESPEQAALREVQEETGLVQLELGPYLGPTYHTYQDGKGRRILKRTFWYRMHSSQTELHPQAEEHIEKAEWRHIASFLAASPVVYGNIRDLLEQEARH